MKFYELLQHVRSNDHCHRLGRRICTQYILHSNIVFNETIYDKSFCRISNGLEF